jgi:hypothetical protein
MSSQSPHQPFSYLDPTCILWCTTEGTITIKDYLSTLPPDFLPSFLNECVKVIDLIHDYWRRKDNSNFSDFQSAIWESLKQWPMDPHELIKVMQVYADGKFRRGVTFKGVVDLSKSSMGKSHPIPHDLHKITDTLTHKQMIQHTPQHNKPSTTKCSPSASEKPTA